MSWDAPISGIRGVGPVRARALAERGITTVQDLLFLAPLRYGRPAPLGDMAGMQPGRRLSLVGHVASRRRGRMRRGRGNYLEVSMAGDGDGRVRVRFYNQAWLFERMTQGLRLMVSGAPSRSHAGLLVADHWAALEEDEDPQPHLDALLPVLPAVPGVPPGTVARLIREALGLFDELGDPLSSELRAAAGVTDLPKALDGLHRPADLQAAEAGGARVLFDRMVALMLPLLRHRDVEGAAVIDVPGAVRGRIRDRFPFSFTVGQEAAFSEILTDLGSGRPMRRLVQGDVGSGKTAVALAAALAVIADKRQVLFLAPTEPLAHQHARVLDHFLQGARVRTALYTARTDSAERRRVEAEAELGTLHLVVATHAAFSSRLRFSRLGLVVIDEQQRFGVRQRLSARQKGSIPHVLSMSATPIPRSLCLALMGDLDHTVIPDRPAGREPVRTLVADSAAACAAVRQAIDRGERAFIVLPAIDADGLPSLSRDGASLVADGGPLEGLRHRFLHGRMEAAERDEALTAFGDGSAPLLLSTVMVEVGIDVPAATVMMVLGADRFGLATLHQLRGRVGRGRLRGHCWLVPSGTATEEARERLQVLEQESDGFAIAEADLDARGPGDILGVRQAGLGGRLLIRAGAEGALLEAARDTAQRLLERGADVSFWEQLGSSLSLPSSCPADAV